VPPFTCTIPLFVNVGAIGMLNPAVGANVNVPLFVKLPPPVVVSKK
jgi:hypothetical protein